MPAKRHQPRAIALGAAAGLLIAATFAPPLSAQPAVSAQGRTTQTVTVVSVDRPTRHLVVKTAEGETTSIKVPEEFHNFGNLKPGDKIRATYTLAAELALSPPDQPLPQDEQTVLASRAAKGELPSGAITNHLVVTGAVVAVDQKAHTLKLVSPSGGRVQTIYVSSPEGRQLLQKLKPGDKITADISESLLISTERENAAGS